MPVLDISHKTDKSGVCGSGDTYPGPYFVHQIKPFFIVHNFRHIQGKVDGGIRHNFRRHTTLHC